MIIDLSQIIQKIKFDILTFDPPRQYCWNCLLTQSRIRGVLMKRYQKAAVLSTDNFVRKTQKKIRTQN